MNWSKAKTILIIFFCIVNILLLINIIYSANRSYTLSSEVIDSTVKVLENNQIKIEKQQIPNRTYDMAYAEVTNVISDYAAFAEKMMGGCIQQSEKEYTFEQQKVTFWADSFVYKTESPIYAEELGNINAANAAEKAEMVLKKYGFDMKQSSSTVRQDGEHYIVEFVKIINQKPVFDSCLTVEMSAQGLHKIKGAWFEQIQSSRWNDKITLKSVTGVLVDFISNPNRPQKQTTITDLRLGYSTYENDTYHKTIVLIPVWQITLEDGSTYCMDTRQIQ